MTSNLKSSTLRIISLHAAVCGIALMLGVVLLIPTGAIAAKGTDLFYYLCVSKLVLAGHGRQVYDLTALGQIERALAYPIHVPGGVLPNIYPPFFAVLLVPLAVLPLSAAYLVWMIVNCLLLGIALRRLEEYAALGRSARLLLRVLTFVSLPVIVALLQGQTSMLLLALLTVCLVALQKERCILAGVALGCTLVKPQFALAFVVLLTVQRRWRALAAFCATGATLSLAALPVLGWTAFPEYVHILMAATHWGTNVGGFAPHWNCSYAGFTQMLLPWRIASFATWVLDLITLALLILGTQKARTPDLPFGLATVAALLVSQHVLIHDLTLLLIPVAVLLRYRWEGPPSPVVWIPTAYLWVLAGFFLSTMTPIQLPTIGMAVLGWCLYRACRRGPFSLNASADSSTLQQQSA